MKKKCSFHEISPIFLLLHQIYDNLYHTNNNTFHSTNNTHYINQIKHFWIRISVIWYYSILYSSSLDAKSIISLQITIILQFIQIYHYHSPTHLQITTKIQQSNLFSTSIHSVHIYRFFWISYTHSFSFLPPLHSKFISFFLHVLLKNATNLLNHFNQKLQSTNSVSITLQSHLFTIQISQSSFFRIFMNSDKNLLDFESSPLIIFLMLKILY